VIRVQAEESRVWILAGARDFSLLQNIETSGSEAHPTSCSTGTGVLPQGKCSQGVILATDFHLASRLWMSRAVLLFPLYAFMSWTGTPLPLPLKSSQKKATQKFDDTLVSFRWCNYPSFQLFCMDVCHCFKTLYSLYKHYDSKATKLLHKYFSPFTLKPTP
jgi:hypothetical protein